MSPLPDGFRRFAQQARREGVGPAARTSARMLRNRPLHALRNKLDELHDHKVAGHSLEVNVVSPFGESHGAVDTVHTPYGTLDAVLGKEKFSKSDVLLDVGCGMGRPLAYLVGKRFPGKLVGVEIDPAVAEGAKEWAVKYDKVEIIAGDAFELDLRPYTVFFMWKPMVPEVLKKFIVKMEQEAIHPFRLYYLSDFADGDFMMNRPGWDLRRRDWVHKVYGIPQHANPQRYSVWVFDPVKAASAMLSQE